MKTFSFLLAGIGLCFNCFAQKPTVKWGEEFTLQKGSSNLEVISADKSGAYVQEDHRMLLIKLDNNLTEVFRNDFNEELKGKEFEYFFSFGEKLFLISSNLNRQDGTKTIYASAVNKSTGKLTGEFKEVSLLRKGQKRDHIDFKITYNADTTRIILVNSITGNERNEYSVQEFDKNFNAIGNPIVLTNEFETNKYQLQDLLYLSNNKILLVGRVYEYEEGTNTKAKSLEFANYNIRLYDEKGKQQAEINAATNGKWLNGTKVIQEKNKDIVLAAFYSNTKKGKTIDGLLVQRININDGTIISTSNKEINTSLLTANNDDDDNDDDDQEGKKEKKEPKELDKLKDEGEGFSKNMLFRNIFYTPDNGLVILTEQYREYMTTHHYGNTKPNAAGTMPIVTVTTTHHYDSGDLMMCKINADGNIGWLEIVPKKQREEIPLFGNVYSTGSTIYSPYTGYFDSRDVYFYSGFAAMQIDGNIQVIFNDNSKNIGVTQAGQKAKKVYRFGKSDCHMLNIDAISGKIGRKQLFSNGDVPIAMPRSGSVINNEMYIVGRTTGGFGKPKFGIARITIK